VPSLATKNAPSQVADDVLRLPGQVPEFPADAFSQGADYRGRAKSLAEWNENTQKWWKSVAAKLTEVNRGNATAINKGVGGVSSNIKLTIDGLTVRINQVDSARINADEALARRIVTVSAIASKNANITVATVPPGSPLINDIWVDTSNLLNPITYFWNGTGWSEQTTPIVAAAVSTEASARIAADGNLSGKYTLTVIAGNIVTGMNITSSTGPGGNISSVIFRATDFLIYNGVTGVKMFVVSGSTVTLGGTFVVDSAAAKCYIGVGNYANTDTPYYIDSAGKFSLGAALTWDGTTLSISSPPVTTVDWNTQVTSRPTELTDGRIALALSSAGLVISGAHPGINVTTGSAGLYMGADFLGYYNGATWKTYMDNSGNFYLGGTGGALQWNGTNLLITGSVTVTGGNAAKVDFSNVTANYAGSPGIGGAANSIVSQGALATLSAVSWSSQVSGRPAELIDGRIPAAINSAGLVISGVKPGIVVSTSGVAGLYLGSDFLGYYNGSAWRTYMDNTGNFYLGGTGGALQWNGSNLLITGSFTVVGGNAAKVDFSNVTANYAGSPGIGGAANTLVSQGALATQNSASWTTQVSGRPTELTDGRIPAAINSAGVVVSGVKPGIVVSASGIAGLYLGSDFLGYYNGSAWMTYMDNAGRFYLGGTSGALQWDGTTLSISGSAVTTVAWATQITGRPTELTDGRIATALSSAGLVISGIHPGINVTTGSAGLYMGADFMGYYNGSVWKTYTDNSGNFYLGGTSGSLQWNGTTLTISGNITVTGGNAAKVDLSNVTGGYAGSPSAGGAANTIVSQGTLATANSANWTTQVSARPVELTDGRIAVAISSAGGVLLAINAAPSGSGLFLGQDFLGYYTGGSWRTYMDSSGNFYLGGVSGALQWNGSTLTIVGGGIFSGALSAASGTFAGSLSAATGTFAGSLSAATGSFAGSLSAASGSFTGALSGATGTFSGSVDVGTNINRVQITSGGLTLGGGSFSGGGITASGSTITIGATSTTGDYVALVADGAGARLTAGNFGGTQVTIAASGAALFSSTVSASGFVSGGVLVISGNNLISCGINLAYSNSVKCNLVVDETTGSDQAFGDYFVWFQNGQQRWVPFLTSAP
jgi:Domain of unknown function (DUF1983)